MTAEQTQPQTSDEDSQPDYKDRFDSLMASYQRTLGENRQLKSRLDQDDVAANEDSASDADDRIEQPDERDARIADLESRLAALESKPRLMDANTPHRSMGGGIAPPRSDLDALRDAVDTGVQQQWQEWKDRSTP